MPVLIKLYQTLTMPARHNRFCTQFESSITNCNSLPTDSNLQCFKYHTIYLFYTIIASIAKRNTRKKKLIEINKSLSRTDIMNSMLKIPRAVQLIAGYNNTGINRIVQSNNDCNQLSALAVYKMLIDKIYTKEMNKNKIAKDTLRWYICRIVMHIMLFNGDWLMIMMMVTFGDPNSLEMFHIFEETVLTMVVQFLLCAPIVLHYLWLINLRQPSSCRVQRSHSIS